MTRWTHVQLLIEAAGRGESCVLLPIRPKTFQITCFTNNIQTLESLQKYSRQRTFIVYLGLMLLLHVEIRSLVNRYMFIYKVERIYSKYPIIRPVNYYSKRPGLMIGNLKYPFRTSYFLWIIHLAFTKYSLELLH